MARGHLGDIWRKAIRGDDEVDDSNELMSYRGIVFGGGFSLLYISFWMYRAGMSISTLVLFILATLILYTGITRIVMEGGSSSRAAGWPNLCRLYAGPYAGPESNIALDFPMAGTNIKGFYEALANSAKISTTCSSAAARSPFA